jgi:hypothetical protein
MPSLEWFVVAGGASRDQSTDQTSLFHVWERIPLGSKLSGCAVSHWWLDEDERRRDFEVVLQLQKSGDEAWEELCRTSVVADGHARRTLVLELSGTDCGSAIGTASFLIVASQSCGFFHVDVVEADRP